MCVENAFLNNIILCVDFFIIFLITIYLNWRNKSIIDKYMNILGGDFTYYPYFECSFQTKRIPNLSISNFFSLRKLYRSLIYYLLRLAFTDPLFFAP